MPISAYFNGNGDQVKSAMDETYKDPKKAKQVFYATAAKKGMKPKKKGMVAKAAQPDD